MTAHSALIYLRRLELAKLIRDCRARYGLLHGKAGRDFARIMETDCGITRKELER